MFKQKPTNSPKVRVLSITAPHLIISEEAQIEMSIYVDKVSDEVGWLGNIRELGDNMFLLENVFLFDQEVHATTTEITPEGLEDFANEILQLEDGIDLWNSMRLWGHSHVNMQVFPSGQDEKQMEEFQKGGHPYFFRLIANKKGDLKVDLFHYEQGLVYEDIAWEYEVSAEQQELEEQIEALYAQIEEKKNEKYSFVEPYVLDEIKAKVRKKTYTVYVGSKKEQPVKQFTHYNQFDVWAEQVDWTEQEIERNFTDYELGIYSTLPTVDVMNDVIDLGYDISYEDAVKIKQYALSREVI